MTPYYQDDLVTLYHGDCLDADLSSAQNFAVVTDPPYGDETQPESIRHLWLYSPMSVAVFGYLTTFCEWQIDLPHPPSDIVAWWPTNGAAISSFRRGLLREVHGIGLWGEWDFSHLRVQKSTRAIDPSAYGKLPDRKISDVWRDAAPGIAFNSHLRQHRNEKPVSVMKRLISGLPPTSTIVDCYAGSGTTLVAAQQMGLKSIGVEKNEEHCETIVRRLSQPSFAAMFQPEQTA